MSSALQNRVKRIADTVGDSDVNRQHVLECLMCYGLVWNHLRAVIPLGHKTREEMTDKEWADFTADAVEFFKNGDGWFHQEQRMIWYICRTFQVPESELPLIIADFVTWPDAKDYGYESQ